MLVSGSGATVQAAVPVFFLRKETGTGIDTRTFFIASLSLFTHLHSLASAASHTLSHPMHTIPALFQSRGSLCRSVCCLSSRSIPLIRLQNERRKERTMRRRRRHYFCYCFSYDAVGDRDDGQRKKEQRAKEYQHRSISRGQEHDLGIQVTLTHTHNRCKRTKCFFCLTHTHTLLFSTHDAA